MLVDDAALTLRPAVLAISAVAMLLQLFVLVVRVRGAIWRDVRAQVLVLALAAVGAFFLFRGAGNQLLMLMSYLVVADLVFLAEYLVQCFPFSKKGQDPLQAV